MCKTEQEYVDACRRDADAADAAASAPAQAEPLTCAWCDRPEDCRGRPGGYCGDCLAHLDSLGE